MPPVDPQDLAEANEWLDRQAYVAENDSVVTNETQNNWVTLDSSFIHGVSYDRFKEQLHVSFSSTGLWVYEGVPLEVYYGIVNADSPGSYYNYNVRGRFEAHK